MGLEDLERRVTALERVVGAAGLKSPGGSRPADDGSDSLWVLHGLAARGQQGVVMAGTMNVPDAGPVSWQYGLTAEALLDLDWAELAATVDALSHPARLTILQLVITGVRTTSDLLAQESLGTTGQLHHHLRQLVAAGWLSVVKRGEYAVPAPRVVPLLVMMLAARR